MTSNTIEVVSDFDVLFAVRTGVTVLTPKLDCLNGGVEIPAFCRISPDNPRDLLIMAGDKTAVLKDLRKEHIDAVVDRGSLLFYEMEDEEVVRCTPCQYQGKSN